MMPKISLEETMKIDLKWFSIRKQNLCSHEQGNTESISRVGGWSLIEYNLHLIETLRPKQISYQGTEISHDKDL